MGEIVGYVILSASHIEPFGFPTQPKRTDPLPATLLGQLATRKDRQGQRYGGSLLHFALRAALKISRDIGSLAVITQPLDERTRGFLSR